MLSGSHLLSHIVSNIVPSAGWGLTIVFGMGTGVSPRRIATGKIFFFRGGTPSYLPPENLVVFYSAHAPNTRTLADAAHHLAPGRSPYAGSCFSTSARVNTADAPKQHPAHELLDNWTVIQPLLLP